MTSSAQRALWLLLLLIPLGVQAQDFASIFFADEAESDYIGQFNYNGKRKNGFGIERLKGGGLYVGDFSEDNISGRGMLISPQKGISHVPGAVVYVGGWFEGKKRGKGRCYDAEGTLIYSGRFEKDKPTQADPMGEEAEEQRFAMVDWDEDLYIGEVRGDIPEGFGLRAQTDGSVLICPHRIGEPQGVGMIVYAPDTWEVGMWTEDSFKSIVTSQAAQADRTTFLQLRKQLNKEARALLFEAATNFAQAGLTVAEITSGNSGGGAAAASAAVADGDAGGSVASGKSLEYYQTIYNKWESKAKKTYEDRVRHKSSATTAGDHRVANADAKLLRTYQKSMRQTRLMAQKNGYQITQSTYETISF